MLVLVLLTHTKKRTQFIKIHGGRRASVIRTIMCKQQRCIQRLKNSNLNFVLKAVEINESVHT